MEFSPLWSAARTSLVLWAALAAGQAAAEVRVLPADPQIIAVMRDAQSFDIRVPSRVIHITGEITSADVGAVEDALESMPEQRQYREHREVLARLDSPGGSFAAGVAIARLFDSHKVPTFVPAGAECLSACAVIFMSGTEQLLGGEAPERRSREIEWPAQLGFHRPFIGDFTSAVSPAVIAEVPAEELQVIFAEEFFQAFDTGNALIQDMLAVDPEAWSTDLLLRMLTATGVGDEQAFVYLETVDDALSWGIDVLNVEPPPVDTRAARFDVAFALCFNYGRQSDSSVRHLWPTVDDLGRHRTYNREEENRRPGTVFREEGRVIDIRWHLWEGHEGCTVTFDGSKLALEGAQKDRVFDFETSMQDRLMGYGPTVRLDQVAIRGSAGQSLDDGSLGRCVVLNGLRVEDDEPCLEQIERASDRSLVRTFVWPSGGRTVVQEQPRGPLINGQIARKVRSVSEKMDFCLRNTTSRRTFCYAGP